MCRLKGASSYEDMAGPTKVANLGCLKNQPTRLVKVIFNMNSEIIHK